MGVICSCKDARDFSHTAWLVFIVKFPRSVKYTGKHRGHVALMRMAYIRAPAHPGLWTTLSTIVDNHVDKVYGNEKSCR